ncbi:MAG: TIGR02300 family protein [Alphaproteobacteria bacterium]|nr:TIGR02300 family protein [Alphaproteobacteria bacterium]
MVKPNWGTKRTCHECSAHFYDMRRNPIICPKCGAEHNPEIILKTRRGRIPNAEKNLKKSTFQEESAVFDLEETEDLSPLAEETDELIEDTSDLGGDEDDMGEVIEHVENEEDN